MEEWTEFKARICHINKDCRMIDETLFCEFVFQNRTKFPYISVLLEISLVMPWSTSAFERGFSAANIINTSHRSCLQQQTMDDLMQVSVNGPSLSNFSPDKALELWWAAAQKKRHVQGHKSSKIQVNEVVYSKISSDPNFLVRKV